MSPRYRHVVYLALGPLRVRAAERYAAQLAADGASVDLVVADGPDAPRGTPAGGPDAPPSGPAGGDRAGVRVHRVDMTDSRRGLRAADRLLLARGGPLADADLLIAGDPFSLPAAWAALGRRPDLPIHAEPPGEPGRRAGAADLAVVTPWYPSPNNPFAGAFVQAALGAVAKNFDRVSILHSEDWAYPYNSPSAGLLGVVTKRLLPRFADGVVRDTPDGELTRVCVPITSLRDYAVWAQEHVRAIEAALPTGRIEAPVVHAHTGIYGGLVAARLARPDARVVVTEHATFLPAVLKQTSARKLYDEVLHRADAMLCVSRYLFDQIAEVFPHHVPKLRIVPNVIDFDDFAVRPEPPRDPLRLLYLGRLTEHKGVRVLVEGFARIAAQEPAATLTLVGSGPLEQQLRDRARELGVADRVRVRPPVPAEQVAAVMHEHDVLVHASRVETFGMTVVEAVATGLPVLVARSAGPQETMAGLEGKAGLLFDISDDPEVIADGYRRLRAGFADLDVLGARAVMRERYSREAVAAQLMEVYSSRPAPVDPPPTQAVADTRATAEAIATETVREAGVAARLVLVAVNPPNFNLTREFVQRMVDRGYGVDVITTDPATWTRAGLAGRVGRGGEVRLHDVNLAERRRPLQRAERLLVYRLPGKLVNLARKAAVRPHSPWPEVAVDAIQRQQSRASGKFHASVFFPAYRHVRPRVLWRVTRRDVLPKLDLTRTRAVVVSGLYGVNIGWRLARRHPGLTVTTSLTRVPDEPGSAVPAGGA